MFSSLSSHKSLVALPNLHFLSHDVVPFVKVCPILKLSNCLPNVFQQMAQSENKHYTPHSCILIFFTSLHVWCYHTFPDVSIAHSDFFSSKRLRVGGAQHLTSSGSITIRLWYYHFSGANWMSSFFIFYWNKILKNKTRTAHEIFWFGDSVLVPVTSRRYVQRAIKVTCWYNRRLFALDAY